MEGGDIMQCLGRVLALSCLLLSGGCTIFPAQAPTASQLMRSDTKDANVYLVSVTPPVVRALAAYEQPGFPDSLRVGSYTPNIVLHPGDVIGITVYENSAQPLFGTPVPPLMTGVPNQAAPQASTLPLQIVESDGTVVIPYVGRVHVGGRTPGEAANLIQDGLEQQTVRPQVVVSLVNNTTNTVAVGGEVNKAGLMPLTLRGERLLDVVAWGGGPKWPAIQTDLRLMRGNLVASVPLQQVMANPRDNVVARPNDSITLVRSPKVFVVMGAAQKVSQYTFDYERVTLAEGIAQGGGGIDLVSNMAGIYLFRYEPTSFARRVLGADAGAVDVTFVKDRNALYEGEEPVPVVYRIDLAQAGSYLLAQQISMRDKDVVLITTAESAQFLKVMQVINSITGAYYNLTRSTNQ
jgi:polysaccharide export outer membrane protein